MGHDSPKAEVLSNRRADVNTVRRERKMGRPNWFQGGEK